MLPYFSSVHVTPSLYEAGFLTSQLPRLYGSFHSPLMLSSCVPTVLVSTSTGISTCRPSATLFSLTLGPDFPRADQLYSGNLGYSAHLHLATHSGILSSINSTAPFGTASPLMQCSSTNSYSVWFLGFGVVFQPRKFSARDLSTSELLRTLSMCGCF